MSDAPDVPASATPPLDPWAHWHAPVKRVFKSRYGDESELTPEQRRPWLADDVNANVLTLARSMARYLVNERPAVAFDDGVKLALRYLRDALAGDDAPWLSAGDALTNGFTREVPSDGE